MVKDLSDVRLIIATRSEDGTGRFVEGPPPARLDLPGVVEAAYLWELKGPPVLPRIIGEAPADRSFPAPGGLKFALVCFPAKSAGRFDLGSAGAEGAEHQEGQAADMHRSDSVDLEVIVSGKVDIVLDSGETRTLGPGDCLVMAGAIHAWRNHYDEPCIYAAFIVGAHPE